jgi:hypothetical protein
VTIEDVPQFQFVAGNTVRFAVALTCENLRLKPEGEGWQRLLARTFTISHASARARGRATLELDPDERALILRPVIEDIEMGPLQLEAGPLGRSRIRELPSWMVRAMVDRFNERLVESPRFVRLKLRSHRLKVGDGRRRLHHLPEQLATEPGQLVLGGRMAIRAEAQEAGVQATPGAQEPARTP